MIESGSLTPGVSADQFGLPPGTALRMELPAPALRSFINYYHVFDSEPALQNVVNRALPAWPMIRFILTDQPMNVRIGRRTYDPLPFAALYGSTSRARVMTTSGGITVGMGLSPLGWARLFPHASADAYRDQIVPLDTLLPPRTVAAMLARLRAMTDAAKTKRVLDQLMSPLLNRPHPREAQIVQLGRLLVSDDMRDIAMLSAATGLKPAALRRLSTRYFGFPPKTLLLRTRFLRSFVPMLLKGGEPDYSGVQLAYFDTSHFLRDSSRFLGVTPKQYLENELGYVTAVLRALQIVSAADAATAWSGQR